MRHMQIDRPLERLVGVAADEIDELLARKYATGPFGEHAQEVELVRREREILAVESDASRPQ